MEELRTAITRRGFLGAVASGASVNLSVAADRDQPSLVIDCHAHIYSEDHGTYPTVEKPYRPPSGKGTLSHLVATMRENKVARATAIQTTTFYRFDNRFLTDSARQNPGWMAGVCNLDPDDPQSPRSLERYVRESNVRGMRSIPARSGRFDDPGVDALWSRAESLGIVINVLAGREHVGEIETMARRHPRLRLVIDHCLNLKSGTDLEPTLRDLSRLARLGNTHAKLSFIPTGSAEPYPCRDMHEPCRRVIATFTPERCVWGSDFPCELWCPKVTYAQHLAIFKQELGLEDAARAAILGETARRLWFAGKA